ncbi:RNI-like protein, partial [Ramicandelaber brevisporus]
MIGSVAADIVGQPAAYFRSLSLKDVAFTEHYGRVISRLLQASDVVDVRQLAIARSVMVLASVKRLFKPLAGSEDGAALVSLSITQCNFGDRSVEYLASALVRGALSLLARLDLSQNVITHDGLAKLVLPEHGLRSRWRLAELNLANNAIGAVGAQHLAAMLSTRPLAGTSQLRLLDISSNVVGEPGLRALWQPLASHRSLRSVLLDGNDLGIPGAEHVASLLRHNTAIVSLSLGRNDLRDQGVERIVNALCQQQPKQQQQIQQQPLTSLSLDLNGLTATAGQHIGRLLQSPHHRLRSLNLAYNRLQCVGCQHMADGLRSNSTLETLDLAANHIAADGARHIASSLRHAVRNGVSSGSGS